MSNDLFADIWGEDDTTDTLAPPRATSRPRDDADDDIPDDEQGPSSKRPRTQLFHSDDDMHDATKTNQKSTFLGKPLPPELDALFPADDDEDDQGLSFAPIKPMMDLDEIARLAEAKHAKTLKATQRPLAAAKKGATASTSRSKDPLEMAGGREEDDDDETGQAGGEANGSKKKKEKGEKKPRKPLPKLDDNRLLGEYGFRALIPAVKKFKPKGKGHEASDLSQVLEMYQLWAHRMYPKTQFRDTIEKVEKVCHSRRMMTSLSVWRDEYTNGPADGKTGQTEQDAIDIDNSDEEEESHTRQFDAEGQAMPLKADHRHQATSSPPTHQLSPSRSSNKAATSEVDDAEMDALMADLEGTQRRAPPTTMTTGGANEGPSPSYMNDDEDDWAAADEMDAEPIKTTARAAISPKPTRPIVSVDTEKEDEDMWGGMDDADFLNVDSMSAPPSQPAAAAADHHTGTTNRSSSSPTIGNTTDHDFFDGETTTTAASASGFPSMDVEVELEQGAALLATDPEAAQKRRESIRQEFEEGWDDMYE